MARDARGRQTTAAREVVVANGGSAPSVAWSAPQNGTKVSGRLEGSACQATAGDDVGVARVDFHVDGRLLNTEREAPWNCSWDTSEVADGAHRLTAVATDGHGNSRSATVEVDVANAPAPTSGGDDPGAGSETPLTFAEECDGAAIDRSKWLTDWGASFSPDTHFLPEQISLGGGLCRMKAERKATPSGRPWAGGLMHTGTRFSQRYGKFEMRAKIPKGKGMWPAFWLLPQSGEWPPEIDVMEIWANPIGSTPADASKAFTTAHYRDSSGNHKFDQRSYQGPDFSQGFHTFAVEWREDLIVMLVDGVERGRITGSHVPRVPAYLIANLAVGSDWGGHPDGTTPSGSALEIDYIRVWQ